MFINVEAAKSIIEKQGDKLVGETKETLETLIKFKEEYDKFNEELESYVSDAYSPLADDLTNALLIGLIVVKMLWINLKNMLLILLKI